MKHIHITLTQMNLILMAVEHGFREGERGKNLQGALASVMDMYTVAPPVPLGRTMTDDSLPSAPLS